MNFSAWSIRNPVAPILAFALLLLLGWQSFNTLPITQFPSIDVPLVSVSVSQPGAAPAELETQVTRKIEDAVAGISGVKNVRSTITDGLSSTMVEFRMEVPTDQAVQDVKDEIDQITGDLPADVETPTVTRVDVEGGAIMTFAVSAPAMTFEELSYFVDDTIKGELQGLPGVGRVDRYGGADREIRVDLDPIRLDAYGITAAAVSQQLTLTNANQGAGRSELGNGEQAIRVLGDQGDAARLAATTIALPTGQQVRLDDLGAVTDTYEELRSFTKVGGQRVVTFGVYRAKGASEVSVSEVVNETLDEIRAANPGVAITLVDDTVFYTEGNYEAALHTLMEGSILAVIVVLLFLRNWRATLISAIALPLSAIPTFYAMDLLGFSLNLISFLALTLATGILVDDAIVEIENIQRHIRMGKTPFRAAIDAADEIGLAVIATTSTIVAVFVPVSFMPGIPGQYFRQFGLTVAIAVIFSLLVARLITPLLAAYFMRAKDAAGHEQRDGLVMRGYMRFVKATATGRLLFIPARYLTLLTAFGVLFVSVYFMMQVPGSLFPPDDSSRFQLSVELPPQHPRGHRARHRRHHRRDPRRGRGQGRVRSGRLLAHRRARRAPRRRVGDPGPPRQLARAQAPRHRRPHPRGPRPRARPAAPRPHPPAMGDRAGGGGPRRAHPRHPRLPAQRRPRRRQPRHHLLDPLQRRGGAERGRAAAGEGPAGRAAPRRRLGRGRPAPARAPDHAPPGGGRAPRRHHGLHRPDPARGHHRRLRRELAKLSLDNRQVPVRVEVSEATRDDLARIGALRVPTAGGGSVPLDAVADIRITEGPSAIERLNRERLVTIGANLPPGVPLGTATARFNEIVASVQLPPGVHTAESGDAEVQQELATSFVNSMILGLLLVLTVLILLFRSVIQPFTILFSLPLAIGGVAAALILTQSPVSMPVMIGILMLMGIVTKNAILLVDFAVEMRARGMTRFEAVVEAGHKRARPIVMTSIAMSAGMLPSALGVGEGGSFRAPMATAVIGGIIASTMLSLVVVPSFFLIMDDLQRVASWVFGRFVGAKEEEPAAPDPRDLAAALDDRQAEIAALEARLLRLEGDRPHRLPGGLHVAE
ncbi:RND multidrug efflux transporter, Acriflavin resistance protein [Rubellimicrobium mesophilum DSM 19309]|uniref:RND multidrug efflux transporter, Acriflavin resistance protein n=1 Tax=Rubellimicrobium mesophilum DSM 19309 TaxID=442562 RepID=A0A017HSR4_9RHOB|nr:RND multidrug efflux transporter, Acriflavin resistance protein [Rubellimicrobium mesophilum DSM 19309]